MNIGTQVIFTRGGGRLGNQVVRFVHWMAWARDQVDAEVLNLAFWPHAHHFKVWREHAACVFPLRPCGLDELARWRNALPARVRRALDWRLAHGVHALARRWPGARAVTLADEELFDLETTTLAEFARPRAFCAGWRFACWDRVERHVPELRAYFQPAPEHALAADEFIGRLRRRHGMVIGVLVRQSDYRQWHDGDFFFSTAQYARWIDQAVALYADARPAVVVASEEAQDSAAFGALPVYQATGNPGGPGHWFENWAELARCDVVLSAPSTFSATAAFQGGVPLWPVVRSDQVLSRDQLIAEALTGAARHPTFRSAVK